jgi:uncharacterized protein
MNEKCVKCYTCMSGVSSEVTVEMFREAQAKGELPKEWFQSSKDCDKCYECMNCFSGQAGRGGTGIQTNYFIFLTNECNLRCDYCYATKTPRVMTRDTLERLKVFLTEDEDLRLGTSRMIGIQFFGGEPTLEWNNLVDFVMEFSDLCLRRYGKPVRWGMTTNGTQLNEERLKFMKLYNIKPLLSLDGDRATHNTHRKRLSGTGSFDDIPLDLIIKYFPDCEIRPTITPETVWNWYEDLLWFHSKGLWNVATEVAYEANWDEDALEGAQQLYGALGNLYVRTKKEGKKFWMKFIDDARNTLGVTEQKGPVCGVARNSVAIDAEGLIYACQRYASFSNRSLSIGNIFKGFDEHKLRETQDLKREYMAPQPESGFVCEDCVARWCCRGGCNAMNFQQCGDRAVILKNHCVFHKMWAEIALKSLARTGELWRVQENGRKCLHSIQEGK